MRQICNTKASLANVSLSMCNNNMGQHVIAPTRKAKITRGQNSQKVPIFWFIFFGNILVSQQRGRHPSLPRCNTKQRKTHVSCTIHRTKSQGTAKHQLVSHMQ